MLEDAQGPEALPDGSLLVVKRDAARNFQIHRFRPESGALTPVGPAVVAEGGTWSLRAFPDGKTRRLLGTPGRLDRLRAPRLPPGHRGRQGHAVRAAASAGSPARDRGGREVGPRVRHGRRPPAGDLGDARRGERQDSLPGDREALGSGRRPGQQSLRQHDGRARRGAALLAYGRRSGPARHHGGQSRDEPRAAAGRRPAHSQPGSGTPAVCSSRRPTDSSNRSWIPPSRRRRRRPSWATASWRFCRAASASPPRSRSRRCRRAGSSGGWKRRAASCPRASSRRPTARRSTTSTRGRSSRSRSRAASRATCGPPTASRSTRASPAPRSSSRSTRRTGSSCSASASTAALSSRSSSRARNGCRRFPSRGPRSGRTAGSPSPSPLPTRCSAASRCWIR